MLGCGLVDDKSAEMCLLDAKLDKRHRNVHVRGDFGESRPERRVLKLRLFSTEKEALPCLPKAMRPVKRSGVKKAEITLTDGFTRTKQKQKKILATLFYHLSQLMEQRNYSSSQFYVIHCCNHVKVFQSLFTAFAALPFRHL